MLTIWNPSLIDVTMLTLDSTLPTEMFDDKVLFYCKCSVQDVDGPWHDFNCVSDAPPPLTKDDKPLDLDFLLGMSTP